MPVITEEDAAGTGVPHVTVSLVDAMADLNLEETKRVSGPGLSPHAIEKIGPESFDLLKVALKLTKQ